MYPSRSQLEKDLAISEETRQKFLSLLKYADTKLLNKKKPHLSISAIQCKEPTYSISTKRNFNFSNNIKTKIDTSDSSSEDEDEKRIVYTIKKEKEKATANTISEDVEEEKEKEETTGDVSDNSESEEDGDKILHLDEILEKCKKKHKREERRLLEREKKVCHQKSVRTISKLARRYKY